MRQGRPTRFFHVGSKISPSVQHLTLRHDYPAHLSEACLELCKNIRAHQVFDEFPDPQSRALRTGKAIHAQGLKLGVSSKWLLGNAIVDVYSKSGEVSSAQKAFDQLETKDVFAWNSIISMHSKRGSLESVVDSFVLLRRSETLPNGFTLAIVLSASARLADPDLGRQIHCNVFKTGFNSDSYCQGAAIDMYAKCNMMNDASRAFEAAKKTDLVSWTVMVTGHLRAGSPEQAIEAFEQMKKHGLVPDQVAYASVISACVGLGKLDRARDLFTETPRQNVVAWNLMISGHAKAGRAPEALAFFAEMRKSGVKPTRSTLGSILSAIASLRALDFGSLVHAHAVKQGLDSNFYVGSSLINMYAKCEIVGDSRRVFDSLDSKNVVLWNAMLGGYAQNRYSSEVMELFRDMKAEGILPDEFTYTSIFSACSSFESLDLGRQLHGVVVKNKLSSNLFVGNALTDMYAKSGALSNARKQFDRMRNRDKVSWNAIIVGYVQEEEEAEAFSMFRKMIVGGVLPDEVSVASILSASANRKALDNGRQVHCLSLKCGLETSLYSGSSLVDMYAKCDNIEAAHKVFSFMPIRGVVSANALIAGYSRINLEKAVTLLRDMRALELSPTDVTFASLLDACDGPDLLIFGKQIHGAVSKTGLLCGDCDFLRVSLLGMYMNSRSELEARILFSEFPNPKSRVIWTSMISGLAQNGHSEEALCLYREMHNGGVLPDQATFATALSACALSASLTDGRVIHALVFHTGLDLDEPTCSALVDMYAKCGDAESSSRVFREMRSKEDVVSWNSMIVGLAKNGHADEAIEVFEEMRRKAGPRPDDVTFLGILTACSHAGKVDEGRRIFRSIARPRADHVACAVDLLGRWGFLDESEELAEGTKFSSDPMVWAALLGSCRLHGDELRGRRVAKKLFGLDPKSSSPYVLLSNMYATSGDWNKVSSVRTEMREKGVAKAPGQSWIVVGRKTHVFVAGDNKSSSEDIDEIRGVLKCLTRLMKDADISPPDVDSLLAGGGEE